MICSECKGLHHLAETKRIFGELVANSGCCSAACYTKFTSTETNIEVTLVDVGPAITLDIDKQGKIEIEINKFKRLRVLKTMFVDDKDLGSELTETIKSNMKELITGLEQQEQKATEQTK